jgi:hypothetical protein
MLDFDNFIGFVYIDDIEVQLFILILIPVIDNRLIFRLHNDLLIDAQVNDIYSDALRSSSVNSAPNIAESLTVIGHCRAVGWHRKAPV